MLVVVSFEIDTPDAAQVSADPFQVNAVPVTDGAATNPVAPEPV